MARSAPVLIHSTILIPGFGADLLRALLARAAFGSALRHARSTGKKKCARQSDCARVRVFSPDLARPDAPGTPRGRSGAQFSRPKRQFLRRLSLWVCTLPHDLPTLTKHCVGARISSFGLVAIVPTSGENSLRRLLGEGFALAMRSTWPGSIPREPTQRLRLPIWRPEQPTRRPRRPTWRPRQPNLAIRRRFQRVPVRPRAIPERPQRPRWKFRRFFVDFSSIFRRFSIEFSTNFTHCVRPSDCVKRFFLARLTAFDRQNAKKDAQLSLSSCVWLLKLARTSSTIKPTTSEPTFYTVLQGKCT